MVRKETVVVKYTREQRRVVVEHYLTHGRCLSRTARELGYPHPGSLASWVNELLDMFDIRRSLSRKGNPYDNAVVESTNRLLVRVDVGEVVRRSSMRGRASRSVGSMIPRP